MSKRSRGLWNPRARFSKSMKMASERSASATAASKRCINVVRLCSVTPGSKSAKREEGEQPREGAAAQEQAEKAAAPARSRGLRWPAAKGRPFPGWFSEVVLLVFLLLVLLALVLEAGELHLQLELLAAELLERRLLVVVERLGDLGVGFLAHLGLLLEVGGHLLEVALGVVVEFLEVLVHLADGVLDGVLLLGGELQPLLDAGVGENPGVLALGADLHLDLHEALGLLLGELVQHLLDGLGVFLTELADAREVLVLEGGADALGQLVIGVLQGLLLVVIQLQFILNALVGQQGGRVHRHAPAEAELGSDRQRQQRHQGQGQQYLAHLGDSLCERDGLFTRKKSPSPRCEGDNRCNPARQRLFNEDQKG